ncbi:MAG: DUF3365 domain-containing protein [Verrucomicrobia bacterium]|nr:DUF3365 domain-containing protein [Verrucomicrobiota bacterium]
MHLRTLPVPALIPALVLAVASATAADITARFVDPEAPENLEIRNLGDRAINRLAVTLVNEVSVAVSKGGAEKAIDVCHLKALPLTGEILSGMPRITAIKRTSLKLRNPANSPDPAEQLALRKVESDMEKGLPPKLMVQQIDLPGGKSEWRVYRPVGILPQCVACHGPKENMSPELQARLKEHYPDDQATGYAAGQFRGLIRVTIGDAPPAPPPGAKSPAPTKKKA